MSISSVTNIDAAVHNAHEWFRDLAAKPRVADEEQAYTILRAVLHVIRDRLSIEECAHFASQLPLVLRGVYYEGWKPARVPTSIETRREFLQNVADRLDANIRPDDAVEAVMELLNHKISRGQMDHLRSQFPQEIEELVSA